MKFTEGVEVSENSGSPARDQLVAVARGLFARHGVAGTSLKMIADELGVTKAAVYHHFRSKTAIVLAVLAPALDGISSLLRLAGAFDDADQRREYAVVALADQAVVHRRLYGLLLGDVTVAQLIQEDTALGPLFEELRLVLTGGPDPSHREAIQVAVFLMGLMGPAIDPRCARIDDALLRKELAQIGRALLITPHQSLDGSAS